MSGLPPGERRQSLGLEPRPADRGDLRDRHDRLGQEQLRLAVGAGRRLRHASIEYLRKARADSSIKAIVLRIDSPGGSAIASDVIWREVMLTQEREAADRVDVRRRRVGRLLHRDAGARDRRRAVDADRLDRRRACTKFVIDGTLKKLGHEHGRGDAAAATPTSYSPVRAVHAGGARARAGDRCRRPTTRSSRRRRRGATRRRRGSTRSAQGRVWTGRQAKEIGLVDELGGLDRAVALAKQRAKIAAGERSRAGGLPAEEVVLRHRRDPFGGCDSTSALASMLGFRDPRALQALTAPLQVFRRGEPLALMPNVFIH